MTDATISPREVGKKPANQRQLIMLAVLGAVLVVVLVVMVLPSLSGGGSSAPPPVTTAPAVTADAAGVPGAGATEQSAGQVEASEPLPPPARPARSPFDPPRG